jgi:superfamily II DNA or RNA helicase
MGRMPQSTLMFDEETAEADTPAPSEAEPVAERPITYDDLASLSFTPRDYQGEAIVESFRLMDAGETGVIVRLFTGGGKTPTASGIASLWLKRNPDNRVLVLCHERQLVSQFAEEIEQFTGIRPGVEMADQSVSAKFIPLITVASRATLMERSVGSAPAAVTVANDYLPDGCEFVADACDELPSAPIEERQKASRLYKFDSVKYNWLVLIDEAHRYAYKLKSVRHIIDWFDRNPKNRRILQTATPERGDGVSLRRLASGIAIDYRMYDPNGGRSAIHDGWCVPYDQRFVTVHGVDFKSLREVSGDFDEGQLEELLTERKALLSMVKPTLDLVEDRRTIIFSPTVVMAKMVAHTINEFVRYRCKACSKLQWEHGDEFAKQAVPCSKCGGELEEQAAGGLARSLDGSYPDHIRQEVYSQHQSDGFQFLSVCSLCREGYNDRALAAVAIFRPTRSRSLAEQMKGRGCRPLPGLVDGLATAEERRAAIAASSKPKCMIIDLVGVTGLADCASTAHILAAGKPDEVINLANANAIAKTGPIDMAEEIRLAEEQLAEEKRRAEEKEAAVKREREKRLAKKEEEEKERKAIREKELAERAAAETMRKLRGDVQYDARKVATGGGGVVKTKQQSGARMPFGKHKGKAVSELPGGYMRVMLEKNVKMPPWLRSSIQGELKRRSEIGTPQPKQQQSQPSVAQPHVGASAPCTPAQARVLAKFGRDTNMSYEQAAKVMSEINSELSSRKQKIGA